MEFTTWGILATYAGALAMTVAVTQLTKGIPLIRKIPTQLWSYFVALCILYPAYFFTGQLDWNTAVLILFNGMIVSLGANGGYEGVLKLLGKKE